MKEDLDGVSATAEHRDIFIRVASLPPQSKVCQ